MVGAGAPAVTPAGRSLTVVMAAGARWTASRSTAPQWSNQVPDGGVIVIRRDVPGM